MKIKNILSKINPFSERKELDYGEFFTNRYILGMNDLIAYGWYEIKALMAWQYYKKISPVYRAVNLIANEFATGITPVLYDNKEDTYIKEYDPKIPQSSILKLLKKPNFNNSPIEFKKALCSSLLVTGDIFIIITGLNEPVELYYENSSDVVITSSPDGYPGAYQISKAQGSETYRKQIINNEIRYMSRDGTRELIQIKEFNPDYQNGQYNGFSRLSPVYYEIEQYLNSNIHNLAMLKKGARP